MNSNGVQCRLCRKPAMDGDPLIVEPADPWFIPARRGYKPIGKGTTYAHADCLQEQIERDAAFKKVADAEFAEQVERMKNALA